MELAASPLGLTPIAPGGGFGSFALSSATKHHEYSFVADADRTLNEFTCYTSAVASQASVAVDVELVADVDGLPDYTTVIETVQVTAGNWPVAGWVTITGFTAPLTAGNRYWIVFRNVSSSPTTQYPTFRYGATGTGPEGAGSMPTGTIAPLWGWAISNYNDVAMAYAYGSCGWRVGYAGPVYDGFPCYSVGVNTTDYVHGTYVRGVKITTPANATLKVKGIYMGVRKIGSPTAGGLRYKLYNGDTLIGTTRAVPAGNVTSYAGTAYVPALLPAAVEIAGGTTLRVVAEDVGASAGAGYGIAEYPIHDDANSRALMPWGAIGTYSDDPSDLTTYPWTEVNTAVPLFALLLDTDGEFAATAAPPEGGGGGPEIQIPGNLGIWGINDYLPIPISCRGTTGAAIAPSVLTYSIYEDATDVGIPEGQAVSVLAPFDSVTGLYLARVQLTAAAGFEVGKNYTVVVRGTIEGVSVNPAVATFQLYDFAPKSEIIAGDGSAIVMAGGKIATVAAVDSVSDIAAAVETKILAQITAALYAATTEPTAPPPVDASIAELIKWMAKLQISEVSDDDNEMKVKNSIGAVIGKAPITDALGVTTRGAFTPGP